MRVRVVKTNHLGMRGITWQCRKCGYIGLSEYVICPRCGEKQPTN